MSTNLCKIKVEARNRRGDVVTSPLYTALLSLVGNLGKARLLYATCFTDEFNKKHASQIKYNYNYRTIAETEDSVYNNLYEPTFDSIKNFEEIKLAIGSKESLLESLNKVYKAGVHTYELAIKLLGSLNNNIGVNKKYIGKLVALSDGKVHFSVVERTRANEHNLKRFIRERSYRDMLTAMAALSGVGTNIVDKIADISDPDGMYNTFSPKELYNNLFELISLKKSEDMSDDALRKFDLKLSEELGHFIADAAYNKGEGSVERALFNKLLNYAKNNKEVFNRFFTKEELSESSGSNSEIEAIGKLLGNYMMAKRSNGNVDPYLLRLVKRFFNGIGDMLSALRFKGILLEYISKKLIRTGINYFRSPDDLIENLSDTQRKLRDRLHRGEELTLEELLILALTTPEDLKMLDLINRRASSDIEDTLNSLIDKFFLGDFRAEDVINSDTPVKFFHNEIEEFNRSQEIKRHIENFYKQMENLGPVGNDKFIQKKRRLFGKLLSLRREALTDAYKFRFDVDTRKAIDRNFIRMSLDHIKELLDEIDVTILSGSLGKAFIDELRHSDASNLKSNVNFKTAFLETQKCMLFLNAYKSVLNLINLYKLHSPETFEDTPELDAALDALNSGVGQIAAAVNVRANSLFSALMFVINGCSDTITFLERMMNIAEKMVGNIRTDRKWKPVTLEYKLQELIDSYNDKDADWYGLNILQANRSPDLITLYFAAFVDYCKFELNIELNRILLELLKLMDLLRKIQGNTDTEWMFERDEHGNLTGNIITSINWHQYEKDKEEFLALLKDKFNQKHKDELGNMSSMEIADLFHRESSWALRLWMIAHCDIQDTEIPNSYNDNEDIVERWVPKTMDEEGNKTSYYSELWNNLSEKLKEFINTYLHLKKLLDTMVDLYRPGATVLHRAPLFRGNFINRLLHTANGRNLFIKGYHVATEEFLEAFFEDCLDTDFGDNTTYNGNVDILSDPEALIREVNMRLPVYGVRKLTKVRHKDLEVAEDNSNALSTDIFYTTMMYAIMATNVDCLELAATAAFSGAYTLNNRTVNGVIESIRGERANHSNIYKRYCKYVEMQIFNIYSNKTTTSLAGMNFVWEKFLNRVNIWKAFGLLAGKKQSSWVNTGTGVLNIILEAMSGLYFDIPEFKRAVKVYTKGVAETYTSGDCDNMKYSLNYRNNKFYRILQYFDGINKNTLKFKEMLTTIPMIFRILWFMHWYENGDHFMLSVATLSHMMHTKLYTLKAGESVTDEEIRLLFSNKNFKDKFECKEITNDSGKKVFNNVYDAFEHTEMNSLNSINDETAYNVYKEDVFLRLDNGLFVRFDRSLLSRFTDTNRLMLDDFFGIMNSKDAAAVLLNALVASMFTMKRFMIGYFNNTFMGTHSDIKTMSTTSGMIPALLDYIRWALQSKDRIGGYGLAIITTQALIYAGAVISLPYSSLLSVGFSGIYLTLSSLVAACSKSIIKTNKLKGWDMNLIRAILRLNSNTALFLFTRIFSILAAKGLINPSYDDEGENNNIDAKLASLLGIENYARDVELLKNQTGEEGDRDPGFLYTMIMRKYLDENAKEDEDYELSLKRLADSERAYYMLGNLRYLALRLTWEREFILPFNMVADTYSFSKEFATLIKEITGFTAPVALSGLTDIISLTESTFRDYEDTAIYKDPKIKTWHDLGAAIGLSEEEVDNMTTLEILKVMKKSDWYKSHNLSRVAGTLHYIMFNNGSNFANTLNKITPGISDIRFDLTDKFKDTDRILLGRGK